ncbi:hypothetical protein NFI96_032688 [Prochilodus magdalenae]|nr:hypothetical protein NFI96_032688 [Prochilodus magdalenae]
MEETIGLVSQGNDDIYICGKDSNGNIQLQHAFSTGTTTPNTISLGNVTGFTSSLINGVISCSFTSANTISTTRSSTSQSSYYIFLAYGATKSAHINEVLQFKVCELCVCVCMCVIQMHSSTPFISSSKIDLTSLQSVGSREVYPAIVKAHGCLMLISWMTTGSIGMLIARYLKKVAKGTKLFGKDFWFVWRYPLSSAGCMVGSSVLNRLYGGVLALQPAVWRGSRSSAGCMEGFSLFSRLYGGVLALQPAVWRGPRSSASCMEGSSLFSRLSGGVLALQPAVWRGSRSSAGCLEGFSLFSRLYGEVLALQLAVWWGPHSSAACMEGSSLFSRLYGGVLALHQAVWRGSRSSAGCMVGSSLFSRLYGGVLCLQLAVRRGPRSSAGCMEGSSIFSRLYGGVLYLQPALWRGPLSSAGCMEGSSIFSRLYGGVLYLQPAVWRGPRSSAGCKEGPRSSAGYKEGFSLFSRLSGGVLALQLAVWRGSRSSAGCMVGSSLLSRLYGGVLYLQPAVWRGPLSLASCMEGSSSFSRLYGGVLALQPAVWRGSRSSASCMVGSSLLPWLYGGVLSPRLAVWWGPRSSASCMVASSVLSRLYGGVIALQPAVRWGPCSSPGCMVLTRLHGPHPSSFGYAGFVFEGGTSVLEGRGMSGAHVSLMLLSVAATIIAFILVFSYAQDWSGGAHPVLGVLVMILSLVQPIAAMFRCGPQHERRYIFNWAHAINALAIKGLAVAAIFTGLMLVDSSDEQWMPKVMGGFVAWEAIFFLFHDFHQRRTEKDVMEQDSDRTRTETILLVSFFLGNLAFLVALLVGIGRA